MTRHSQSWFPALLATLFLVHGCAVMPDVEPANVAWVSSGDFCEPETVLPLPDKTFLVSNVCDFRQEGSGYLSVMDAEGHVLKPRAVDHLDSPLGMAFFEDRIYVVDANRVRLFAWPDYAPVDVINLDTRVANDVAVAGDGSVFVSDSARHQVVRVSPEGEQSVFAGEGRFENANGMAIRDNTLYVGGARVWAVDLSSEKVTTVGPAWMGDIDGIEFESDGTLQVTIVGGPLIRYRGRRDVQILGGDRVSSTNHGYSPEFGLALIPTGYDNTVIALKIDDLKNHK